MKNDALTGAPWLLAVARVFERAGEPVYLVGGAVRNPLMGLPLSDVDVCGPARPERVMALGDYDNDAGMLAYAGVGVAMGNASPRARAAAKYVTLGNDEDGVALAIRRYALS